MKLVIPSAGIGSRLGAYTKNFNKALVTIGNQPSIIRIINDLTKRFDIEEVVVLTGYQAELLEEVLHHFRGNLRIRAVRVDNFSGTGSSLTHTLLQAKEFLQTDFIFCANDTICTLPASVNNVSCNWLAYYKKRAGDLYQPRQYRTIDVNDQLYVTKIYPKDYGTTNIYVGLAYIRDYSIFWNSLENSDSGIGEVIGLKSMKEIRAVEVEEWHDCGMITSLGRAKNLLKKNDIVVLEKQDEAIWFANNIVVKQHIDKTFIADRIKRLQFLPADLTPVIEDVRPNSFSYKHIPGRVITQTLDQSILHQLLSLMNEKMWKNRCTDEKRTNTLEIKAHTFYKDKTKARILQYFTENEIFDCPKNVNGMYISAISDILERINWNDFIGNSIFSWFHGDFHNENILFDGNQFTLIDWRQNFTEGEYEFGDVYYDLAKFQHGLLISHPIVDKELFSVEYIGDTDVRLEIYQSSRLLEINRIFEDWVVKNGYCRSRVRLLTALIYLNIAVLHEQPYGQFLFFYGRLLLQREYEDLESPYFVRNSSEQGSRPDQQQQY